MRFMFGQTSLACSNFILLDIAMSYCSDHTNRHILAVLGLELRYWRPLRTALRLCTGQYRSLLTSHVHLVSLQTAATNFTDRSNIE